MTTTAEKIEELKPCPFCGGDELESIGNREYGHIACNNCLSTGPMQDSVKAAKKAWNTREVMEEE